MNGSNSIIGRRIRSRGFALVLVIVLLGFLLLVTYALSVSARIDAQAGATAEYRLKARQNALAALAQAVAELQALAGPDGRITGMAGITGVEGGRGRATRHWCGVWTDDGRFLGWLVSGAGRSEPALSTSAAIKVVGEGTVGADATDKEHVVAGLLPVPRDVEADKGAGRIAWWIGDEGIKLSAVIPADEEVLPGARHAVDELIPSLDPEAAALARVLAYEQLAFVPNPNLTPSALQANFHALGVGHAVTIPAQERCVVGPLNVNTTSVRFWRGVVAIFNRGRAPDEQLGISIATVAQRIANGFPAAIGPGKDPAGPYWDVESFLASDLMAGALAGSDITPGEFGAAMYPWLAVRSDTFRIRAYGDAANRADDLRLESTVWCEAIVQRTGEELPGHGRRFRIVRFRWLPPGEI